jgi:hypothetical protein
MHRRFCDRGRRSTGLKWSIRWQTHRAEGWLGLSFLSRFNVAIDAQSVRVATGMPRSVAPSLTLQKISR